MTHFVCGNWDEVWECLWVAPTKINNSILEESVLALVVFRR